MTVNRRVVGVFAAVSGMIAFLALRLRRRARFEPPGPGPDLGGVREPRVPAPSGGSAAAEADLPGE